MLKNTTLRLTREYLFWMLLFMVLRAMFVFYNISELTPEMGWDPIKAFWHAVRLDTSMACYFVAPSLLFYLFHGLTGFRIFIWLHRTFTVLLLLLVFTVHISELEIYDEWGTKVSVKALRFLEHPGEVMHTTRPVFLFWSLLFIQLGTFFGAWLHFRLTRFPEVIRERKNLVLLVLLPVFVPLIGLGIRGGTNEIPIQLSDAYFSKHNIVNLASVNSTWNLMSSIFENKVALDKNPYVYYSEQDAKVTVDSIYDRTIRATPMIFKNKKPNIVLVILEGWSADLVHSFGGYDSITPNFDKLCSEGFRFDSLYASGNLSDQGMAAIFSAFPAQPYTSIITQPNKFSKLPCLAKTLKKEGYSSSFVFGGQLTYGNIKSYMYFNEFDRILEEKDFDENIPRGKLGIHDEYVLARQIEEMRTMKQPFFASLFTASSHSPYDHPGKKDAFNFNSDEDEYVNAVHYADGALGKFVENCKKEFWYNNSIFIFISDHSHKTPKGYERHRPEYRRIPLLFWGPGLADSIKGKSSGRIFSQIDLASGLLTQLGISDAEFTWSKDMFSYDVREFAYYENTDGFGWIRPGQYLVWSHDQQRYYFEKTKSPAEKARLEKEGKSYLQVLFQQYTNY
jgi:phosphoglycerol transferase MdoB-like AlkP superfamily enzyme